MDIVQQKSTRVKVECTISFSSQKFDEKGGRAATYKPHAHRVLPHARHKKNPVPASRYRIKHARYF
ncbi:hypothetical protein HMPREF1493_1234 [Atopobium sp. ICM42b]|nr:hypothetical protein HMPREF1493_1234 [Atopobium sp. ICM42b]